MIFSFSFSFSKNKAYAYDCFKKYERKEFLTRNELEYANDHICLNLNCPNLSYKYFYNMYSYTAKSQIVLRWKKERNGYQELVKFGEAICKDKLINFLKMKNTKNVHVQVFIIRMFN